MLPAAPPHPHGTLRLLTLANLDGVHARVRLPAGDGAELVHSSDPDRDAGALDPGGFLLLPGEVVVVLLGAGP